MIVQPALLIQSDITGPASSTVPSSLVAEDGTTLLTAEDAATQLTAES